jgi:mannose-6-phosphate isomerase
LNTHYFYPLHLESSLHETIWGGRRLSEDGWKRLPEGDIAIGESWETEVSTIVQNGPYQGKTLGFLVEQLGESLLGTQAVAIFGQRFPLLAKFIDANAQLSVQVHPKDDYAHIHEGGKLGKTEFWYILKAEPGATIVHGFKQQTNSVAVHEAIQSVTLDTLMHEEPVQAGDVVFVPAGTVHAIGGGILLYELQEYSDITYRMYDYGRLSATGIPRELHIDRSLAVSHYTASPQIKMQPIIVTQNAHYEDRCLVACKYFVAHEIRLQAQGQEGGGFEGQTSDSCVIISSLGADASISYGDALAQSEKISRGQSMVLPAALGRYRIEGHGSLLFSYVPEPGDIAWQQWAQQNKAVAL